MRILHWHGLSAAQRRQALRRPAQRDAAAAKKAAQDIIDAVRRDGDAAIFALTEKYDRVRPDSLRVTAREFRVAEGALSGEQTAAIERAIDNVRLFHAAQAPRALRVETAPGVSEIPPVAPAQ